MHCVLQVELPVGHGPIIHNTGIAKVKEYISHRELRESQIMKVLRAKAMSGQYSSSWQLMREVYKDSLATMPWLIQGSAQGSTLHHLEKLRKDGAVESKWPDLWRISTAKESS